jgi:Protein of unknown function (DUF2001).
MGGVNKRHISLKEGSAFIDGVKVLEAIKLSIVVTPEVWSGRSLGEKGKSRRWLGIDVTGSLSEYKSTPWYKEKVNEYIKTGKTPEMVIQGIQDDKNSDFNETYGSETVTLKGCVITGDIPILDLDTDGEVVKNQVSFGAHDIIM